MQGVIHVIAQSHIDVAWLWRYDPETIFRCCKPTFTRATNNMDKYPEYIFSQSQVPLYKVTKETFPKLFEKMRKYIEEGRWEIVGGMYIEFEGGEPCGESIVRQCVMGKRYFMEEFGVDVKTGWQEDAWSHPWQIPQIFKKCGIDFYMFKRGEKGEKLFWWQAPDGSKVLTYKPFHSWRSPADSWGEFLSNMKERYGVKDVMIRIGGGDHGGGPGPEEIEAIRKFARDASPEIEVKFNTFRNFMETIAAQKPDVPVLNHELGFELTGDLTNCGEIKKSNRECEILLLNAEKFCSIASILFGNTYPSEELYESWRKVLFNQFHDIIGGSGIPPVCKDAAIFYEIVEESGKRLLQDSINTIVGNVNTEGDGVPVLVMNTLPWERTEIVEATVELSEAPKGILLLDESGEQVPIQVIEKQEKDDKWLLKFIFVAEDVPSLGYTIYRVVKAEENVSYSNPFSINGLRVENEFFSIEIDPNTGCLKSIFDKRNAKEVLDGSGNMLVAIEDDGDSEGRFVRGSDSIAKPPGKAWELTSEPSSIEICEEGPVRTRVRVKRSFHNSSFTQDIILYSSVDRLDFNLIIDWHDIHWMIKLAFPVSVENPELTYNSAYGSVVRPADGLECSAQKWVDLSSADYGVALLNNSRYGHDVDGQTIRVSVLRSPTSPAYNTDEGVHLVGYSIYPHSGDWREGGVMRRGYEYNHPLISIATGNHPGKLPSSHSFVKVDRENVIVEVLKKAYDTDEFILRLYETRGESCAVDITMPCKIGSACETDLLENKTDDVKLEGNVLKTRVAANEIKTLKFTPGR